MYRVGQQKQSLDLCHLFFYSGTGIHPPRSKILARSRQIDSNLADRRGGGISLIASRVIIHSSYPIDMADKIIFIILFNKHTKARAAWREDTPCLRK